MSLMEPDLELPMQSHIPDALPSSGDRYADLLPAPQGEQVLPEFASAEIKAQSSARSSPRHRCWPTGSNHVLPGNAGALSQCSFPADVIERAAKDNLVNRKATSLELLATLPRPWFHRHLGRSA